MAWSLAWQLLAMADPETGACVSGVDSSRAQTLTREVKAAPPRHSHSHARRAICLSALLTLPSVVNAAQEPARDEKTRLRTFQDLILFRVFENL